MRAPEQLGEEAAGVDALGQRVAVAAVMGEHDVVAAQRRDGADGDRLLADRGVDRALDLAVLVGAVGELLEARISASRR